MNDSSRLPIIAAFFSILSVQTSAAISKTLFPLVGSDGVAALRIGVATIILFVLLRPYTLDFKKADIINLIIYGSVLGLMNFLIYRAFSYIPVGIAVSIEVTGPLCVALLTSHNRLNWLWVSLALIGVILLPAGAFAEPLDIKGLLFAMSAATCWALYIVSGKRVAHMGSRSVAAGMVVSSMLILPIGFYHAGTALLAPKILLFGLAIAILSSIFPYLLDMYALKHLPGSVFGILMSASPAMSAMAGYLILGEKLSHVQWLGILSISSACLGCSLAAIYKSKSLDTK